MVSSKRQLNDRLQNVDAATLQQWRSQDSLTLIDVRESAIKAIA